MLQSACQRFPFQSPHVEFQWLLKTTSQSITDRGLVLYASDPQKYSHLAALPFPTYIPALSEDLKTPEFTELLSSASSFFGKAPLALPHPRWNPSASASLTASGRPPLPRPGFRRRVVMPAAWPATPPH